MGLGAVINVVTKEKQNGGSVGLNTQNAVTTGFGNNVVNFKYNWGHSQLGVTYNIIVEKISCLEERLRFRELEESFVLKI